ncbi:MULTISPECIES: HypC/HybG/HupF family hydrogenase formation chaperone [Acidianus]|uniref:Hydrogenase n=1 Tax=Candidatus Acidianus copahuensis TaxID=1160895 RepID=A0A031LIK7_9CREN|nr:MULTISPECIES: HypC/HybG/HupF family hydrogenase formation chaperone [Acidianus]EZQ01967.1 hydrogenase [Candidatus Acidianus copahuensis]NON61732.1 HypC/HybG/HupF family hydrogenase formation chaperone [Acidianus sp. RZ1]
MCLSFPAKIVNVQDFIAFVDYGNGIVEPVILNGVEVKEGDYVVVSYGMILERIDEKEYKELIEYEKEIVKAIEN